MIRASRHYIQTIARTLSGKDIEIKEGKAWKSDVVNKVLYYNPADLFQLPTFVVKGLILHEIAHLKYSTEVRIPPYALDKNIAQQIGDTYNCLEDMRIERKLISEYGAYAAEGLLTNTQYHIQGHVNGDSFFTLPKLQQFLYLVIAYNTFTCFHTKYNQYLFMELLHTSNAAVRKRINQLSAGIVTTIQKQQSTEEIQIYVDTILYPLIADLFVQDPPDYLAVHLQLRKPFAGKGHTESASVIPTDAELEAMLSPYITTVASKLASILIEKKSTRYTGSHKSGKLLDKNTFKVLTDTQRIFSRKTNPNIPHYVVSFLLDESGSMEGDRHVNTYIATYLLKRVCERLKFPINIITFTDDAQIREELQSYRKPRFNNTNEGSALQQLKKCTSPTDDNIVFLLTDGATDDVREEITKLTRNGYEFIAIAIGLNERQDKENIAILKSNHPQVILAPTPSQLPAIMVQSMQRFIHR